MERAEVFAKTAGVIADVMGVDESIITEATGFEDLNADSLDVVEVIMGLEDGFGVSIPDEEADHIKTVGGLVDFLSKNV